MFARMKFKELDERNKHLWVMLVNSTMHAKPYLFLYVNSVLKLRGKTSLYRYHKCCMVDVQFLFVKFLVNSTKERNFTF
jgi:hypothetical protein